MPLATVMMCACQCHVRNFDVDAMTICRACFALLAHRELIILLYIPNGARLLMQDSTQAKKQEIAAHADRAGGSSSTAKDAGLSQQGKVQSIL